MEDQYFVIGTDYEGTVTLHSYTKEQLLSLADYWHNWDTPINVGDSNSDLSLDRGLYIIKGKLVQPKPVAKVTEWVVE